LRWRLTLSYTCVLVILLFGLAFSLNFLVGRAIFNTDVSLIYNEAKSDVATNQRTFDLLVRGRALYPNCADAISYQDAFQDEIAGPLVASHAGVQAVYLLTMHGDVLAPLSSTSVMPATGPYLRPAQLAKLVKQWQTGSRNTGTGYVTDVNYMTTDGHGQQLGIILIGDRFYTASHCAAPTAHIANGIVEVITTYPTYQQVMMEVRVLLIAAMLAALVVGLLIGRPLTAAALRPLSRMTQAARRIASGDLTQRVRLPHTEDEVGLLAGTFDEMIERIDRAFAAQVASEERVRQFVADASHELRTPLTAIQGGIEVLRRGAKEDADTLDHVLRTTQREAERMSRLLSDLLTLARLDAGRPLELQSTDLIALAGEAVDQARLLAGERPVLMETDHLGRLMVQADGDRLKQVLLILLDNALKYGRQSSDAVVTLRVARDEASAIIQTSDNGPGIAPDDLSRIFDRFYRANRSGRPSHPIRPSHPSHPRSSDNSADADDFHLQPPSEPHGAQQIRGPTGSGLGLAIARALVQAHGGTISVTSQLGVGTTFSVTLPLERAMTAETPRSSSKWSLWRRSGGPAT
jgi:two-component system OmpR family sensor kinase